MTIPEKHQLKIARQTLRLSDVGARIMGGMTKAEALDVILRLVPPSRPRYRDRDSWVLGQCLECGATNYVEPHGTTAQCRCSKDWTEHRNLPFQGRN